jgi:hypothetical protein
MLNTFKSILVYLFLIFMVGCVPEKPVPSEEDGFEHIFRCGAELVDGASYSFPEAGGDSLAFGNVNARTYEEALSGDFALKLTPQIPYGFTTNYTAGPDEYLKVTAWRKGAGDHGAIVIDGGNGFYNAGKHVVEENSDGWQKIMLEVYTPPHISENNLKIFLWNVEGDSVYFDDIQIVHRKNKEYPLYDQQTALNIYTEEENLNYFNQKRFEAFQSSVLVNTDEDYANAVIYNGNEFLNGDIRLKGDLMDHIQGDKWSFRIKLKSEFAWNHVLTFSIHNPATRNFLHEWLAHQIFTNEDVLTTRYGITPVVVNNQSKGIYAWEEHFEKHLVENRNRREGPIVRFDETLYWNRILEHNKTGILYDVDYFGAAQINPFKEGSVAADTMKTMQAVEARRLLMQYKNWSAPVSQIFDIEVLAKYYALMDITQAYHGFTWHNQRFYFNPVTCLLEPIAFDGYIEGGVFKRIEEPVISLLDDTKIDTLNKEELLLYQVFTDSIFNAKYVHYLKQYSDPKYIDGMIEQFKPESDSLAKLIRQEFPYYQFDFDYISQQAGFIHDNIGAIEDNIQKLEKAFRSINRNKFSKTYTADVNPGITPLLVHAYYDKNNRRIDILNYHAAEVSVIGALITNSLPENFASETVLAAYDGLNPDMKTVTVGGEPYRILFSVDGELMETEISQWPYSNELSSRQQLRFSEERAKLPEHGDSILFDGSYTFNTDVYIPEGKQVVLKAGTQINLTNGAGFFSLSAINSEGTENNRVEFFSGDQNSQGVHILQAKGRSVLKHTRFNQLGNIRKGGWQTPSAVTFYEADVDFYNCTFEANIDCDDALNTVRSDFYAKNCTFINTFADAFDSDFCTGKVVDCIFQNIGNDAIDFSGSLVTITGCEMYEVTDKAISAGENSKLIAENCIIEKATIGIASKDSSHVELNNIEMYKVVYGFVSFIKKPEYGPASIEAENLKMKRVMVFHQIEEGSVLNVNNRVIHGRERNLAIKLYQ